jgi:hypothetical protein
MNFSFWGQRFVAIVVTLHGFLAFITITIIIFFVWVIKNIVEKRTDWMSFWGSKLSNKVIVTLILVNNTSDLLINLIGLMTPVSKKHLLMDPT